MLFVVQGLVFMIVTCYLLATGIISAADKRPFRSSILLTTGTVLTTFGGWYLWHLGETS